MNIDKIIKSLEEEVEDIERKYKRYRSGDVYIIAGAAGLVLSGIVRALKAGKEDG